MNVLINKNISYFYYESSVSIFNFYAIVESCLNESSSSNICLKFFEKKRNLSRKVFNAPTIQGNSKLIA